MDNSLHISGFIRGSMLLNLLMSAFQLVFVILYVAIRKPELLSYALAVNLPVGIISFLMRRKTQEASDF